MPRAIVLSIVVVVALYVVMSTVILGVMPWREAQQTRTIASLFIARTFSDPATGQAAALAMTVLILFVTASSLYAVILGYSRIPFAAARDGQFFEVFGRLHPTKHFPHISLLTIGAVAIPFCFFTLGQLVSWLILVQILVQFVWQCAGVILLRRYRPDIVKPFRMWLYPLPALVSLAMWIYIFVTGAGRRHALRDRVPAPWRSPRIRIFRTRSAALWMGPRKHDGLSKRSLSLLSVVGVLGLRYDFGLCAPLYSNDGCGARRCSRGAAACRAPSHRRRSCR